MLGVQELLLHSYRAVAHVCAVRGKLMRPCDIAHLFRVFDRCPPVRAQQVDPVQAQQHDGRSRDHEHP